MASSVAQQQAADAKGLTNAANSGAQFLPASSAMGGFASYAIPGIGGTIFGNQMGQMFGLPGYDQSDHWLNIGPNGENTGPTVGGGIGSLIGTYFGMPMVGGAIGSGLGYGLEEVWKGLSSIWGG